MFISNTWGLLKKTREAGKLQTCTLVPMTNVTALGGRQIRKTPCWVQMASCRMLMKGHNNLSTVCLKQQQVTFIFVITLKMTYLLLSGWM